MKVEGGRQREKEGIVRREIVSSKWKQWNLGNLLHAWNKNCFVK